MQKELTISIDEQVYESLYKNVGQEAISQFIENLIRSHVIKEKTIESDLRSEYEQMSADQEREAKALEWSEGLIGDVANEAW